MSRVLKAPNEEAIHGLLRCCLVALYERPVSSLGCVAGVQLRLFLLGLVELCVLLVRFVFVDAVGPAVDPPPLDAFFDVVDLPLQVLLHRQLVVHLRRLEPLDHGFDVLDCGVVVEFQQPFHLPLLVEVVVVSLLLRVEHAQH